MSAPVLRPHPSTHRSARSWLRFVGISVLGFTLCAGSSFGQPLPPSPLSAPSPPKSDAPRRVLRLFDFDDANNPDPVPIQWERTSLTPEGQPRAGFPKFNLAILDRSISKSGQMSVKLPTAGGCTALRLLPSEVPIFADADYAIAAQVRTEGLEHARAFLTGRLLDQELKPIPGSETRSEPVAAGGLWTSVSVRVPGRKAGAAWLQIDLELLQERQFTSPLADEPAAKALAQHKIWREDVRGAAWFDDVTVLQIPQATLTTTSPSNIVVGDEPPTLVMTVRDLGGDALKARVRVRDLTGNIVAEHLTPIDPGGRPVNWTPDLPGYGWFSAQMDVIIESRTNDPLSLETAVSRGETRFIHIPARRTHTTAHTTAAGKTYHQPGTSSPLDPATSTEPSRTPLDDTSRFGIIAEQTPDERVADLPELLDRLGTGFVYLPAWNDHTTLESAAPSLARRRAAIEALLRAGQVITLSLDGVPAALARAARIPADDAIALSTVPTKEWVAYLSPTLDIFGQRILRYQIGGHGDDHAFWKKSLAADLATLETALSGMVPGPMVSIPWVGDRAWSRNLFAGRAGKDQKGEGTHALTLEFPLAFPPSAIAELIADFQMPAPSDHSSPSLRSPELTVVLDLPSSTRFGGGRGLASVTELGRRAVEYWRVCADGASPQARLAVNQPWRWSDDASSQVWPSPEAAAFVTLMDRLSGRRIVGELRSTPGVKCYVLAAKNAALGTLERGALVAWNESADPSKSVVEAASIGSELTVIDIFGNPLPLASSLGGASAGGASPLVSVPVTESPIFIEGIDPYLALFAASFRLDPSFMPAVVREHEHRITLTNPWPLRITGKLQLKEDTERSPKATRTVMDEWRVSPSGIIDFDIGPGQTLSVPVTLSFGPGQLAGTKDFVIVARAMADRAYPPVRLKASIEVGLEDIELEPEIQPSGPNNLNDVVVVAAVTNKGSRHRTFRLETAAKNMPSQQLQISDLPPGQTVLRRFLLKDAAKSLSGRRVVISLSDLEEAQRLNKAVMVP